MKHLKALTENRWMYGRSLCGCEDVELTTNDKLVGCDKCKVIAKDFKEHSAKVGIDIGLGW